MVLETRLALLENRQVREVEWTISDYTALLESCPKGQCITSPTFSAAGIPNMQSGWPKATRDVSGRRRGIHYLFGNEHSLVPLKNSPGVAFLRRASNMDDAAELSSLSRELLRCQLDDLDVFLNNARQLQLPSLPPLPPEERQQEVSLPLPPLDSANVLEAQLQNVEEPLPQRREMEGAGLVPLGGPRPGTLRFEAPARGGCLDQLDLQDLEGPGKRPAWTMIPEKKLEVDGEEPTEAGFLFDLETECYFRAWSSIASTMRRAKRQKREENSRRYLGKKAKAQVMWALVDGLYGYEVCRFVRNADTLSRGQRMRLAPRGRSGSRCKVLFDGKEEAEMVATEELLKVQIGAHPYAAGVAFLVPLGVAVAAACGAALFRLGVSSWLGEDWQGRIEDDELDRREVGRKAHLTSMAQFRGPQGGTTTSIRSASQGV
eukprot:symbB.v1.2.034158.t1/scaffold4292.1/size81749/1